MEEMVNPIGDTKRAENTSGKERQKSITDREIQNRCPSDFMEQVTRLRELAKDAQYYRVVVEILYTTGIRISELSAMKKEDINWSERSIVITKGKRKKSRIVLFTRECGEQLSRYLKGREDDMPNVFVNTTGKGPICHRTVQKKLAEYGDQLGMKITPHTLRHTFASHLAMKGMLLSCIEVLLGHEEMQHTQLYARLYDHARKETYDQFM
ncbi:site-specific recombinase XerD [Lysinibacillus sp. RC46]